MLIIAEKPSVARKISSFLSNNNFRKIYFSKNMSYYFFKKDNKNIFVVPSIGHLFTISDLNNKYTYPTFNYKWVPSYVEDGIKIKKLYIYMLSKFRNENEIIIATDYDIEGELIGYNILRFILNKNSAKRMIFSAITYKDILRAYNNLGNLNVGYYLAGETRHIVDWLYGINLSRALTRAIRHYNKNIILSIGRVQGPTLKLVYLREREIKEFVPEEYYKLEAIVKKEGKLIKFLYKKEKIENKDEAIKIKESIGKYLNVLNIESKKLTIDPLHPYNLTDIQVDAYKLYKISPKNTLDILQSLYERGYVSYPRTSSQRLPDTINFREIFENLLSLKNYKTYIEKILKKEYLKPNNGKKDDVHPAIHPTGVIPENLNKKEFLIYDLVVRRFIATFSDPAVEIHYKINTKEGFYYEYKNILDKGWIDVYWEIMKYNYENNRFYEGEKLEILKLNIRKTKTKPPSRYNQASLVKRMEELNLGTKSTRAEIVSILFKRNYVKGKSIYLTELGEKIIEILEKYYPEILDIGLTRKLEEKLDRLEKNPKEEIKEEIINEVKEILKNVLTDFKNKEEKIGEEIYSIIKGKG
ncbi:MAG: DNA topoisomerase I [Nanopusillaceae archaeon]